jgi:hypothetical protein
VSEPIDGPKGVTDEYRSGWDRIFGTEPAPEVMSTDIQYGPIPKCDCFAAYRAHAKGHVCPMHGTLVMI